MTEAQYHRINEAAQEKHEFVQGKITRRASSSFNHAVICADTLFAITQGLRLLSGKRFRIVGSDQKIRVQADVFFYPDLVVVPPQGHYDENHALWNPVLVVEVTSPSTREYDAGEKRAWYQSIAVLRHYLLIQQDTVSVTHYQKNEAGIWETAGVYQNRSDTFALALSDMQIMVSVGEIYDTTSFD